LNFKVTFAAQAREDLQRLYQHLLEKAATMEDLGLAERARDEVNSATAQLARSPFIYRKATGNPLLRELLIPFGSSGYVMFYKILDANRVTVLAVRHQLEDDYH
jgi:plasmid stabilization system protein ParE